MLNIAFIVNDLVYEYMYDYGMLTSLIKKNAWNSQIYG